MNIIVFLTLIQIAVILMIGLFFGSMIMFYWNYREIKNLQQELDNCCAQLDAYYGNYEDDEYEAY